MWTSASPGCPAITLTSGSRSRASRLTPMYGATVSGEGLSLMLHCLPRVAGDRQGKETARIVDCVPVMPTGQIADAPHGGGPSLESSQESNFPGILHASMTRPPGAEANEEQAGQVVTQTAGTQVPGSSTSRPSQTRSASKHLPTTTSSKAAPSALQDDSALNGNLHAATVITAVAIASQGGALPTSPDAAPGGPTPAGGGGATLVSSALAAGASSL